MSKSILNPALVALIGASLLSFGFPLDSAAAPRGGGAAAGGNRGANANQNVNASANRNVNANTNVNANRNVNVNQNTNVNRNVNVNVDNNYNNNYNNHNNRLINSTNVKSDLKNKRLRMITKLIVIKLRRNVTSKQIKLIMILRELKLSMIKCMMVINIIIQ